MAKRLNGQFMRPAFVIIVGGLAILIVYFVPHMLEKKIDGKATDTILSKKITPPFSFKKVEKEITSPLPKDIKRDPFLPSYMKLEGKSSGVFSSEELGFFLTGIMWDPKNPVAIVNGEIMHIGDTVNGKKILEIHKDCVIFGEGEARYTVTVWE
jgi:hypothetical protein